LLDLDEAIAHVDEIDHLGLFELSVHRAALADAIGLVELEHSLLDWQLLLSPQVHGFSRSYGAIERKNFRLDDAGRQPASSDDLATLPSSPATE
jgi:hypothetical protein